jgi:hypothetical protein
MTLKGFDVDYIVVMRTFLSTFSISCIDILNFLLQYLQGLRLVAFAECVLDLKW